MRPAPICAHSIPFGGSYRYTRLPFGVKAAGDIFIQRMSRILGDLDGVEVVADDILVFGKTLEEHNSRLEAVLKQAQEVDLRLNPDKSQVCKVSKKYLI